MTTIDSIDTIDKEVSDSKVFKEHSVPAAAFLGGPLAAGYILATNFKALGQDHKIVPTWIVAILATLAIFVGAWFIPDDINIPNTIIPLAFAGIAFIIYRSTQSERVQKHIQSGGKVFSWGRTIAVALIGALISAVIVLGTLTFVFGVTLLGSEEAPVEQKAPRSSLESQTYGKGGAHQIDYDSRNISEKEINQIADALGETGFYSQQAESFIYVVNRERTYELYFSINEGTDQDESVVQSFTKLRSDLDNHIPQKGIAIKLAVNNIQNVVKSID
ncbi:hypothetical protein [Halocola ammonii]